jgi:hypothetical protein
MKGYRKKGALGLKQKEQHVMINDKKARIHNIIVMACNKPAMMPSGL